jgi:anti-anti-sigma factor
VVVVAGELDMLTVGQLRAALEPLRGSLTLDFANLEFIDSQGLGLVAATARRLDARGDKLVLRNVSPAALRVIELSGFDRLLSIED